jgi:membrane-anchored protein YejM (alkaline phosphatase superfamily)
LKPLPTFFAIGTILLFTSMACKKDVPIPKNYKANNVVVIIIDGPRYSETFGDTTHQYMPELYQISKQGVLFTNMYNIGITNTLNGLSAITTGNYGALPNNGTASPMYNNYLYYFIKHYHLLPNQAWMISSKDKVESMKTCADCNHSLAEIPNTNCGINGLNTGYRNDSVTMEVAKYTMQTYHPNALFIHFKEPDAAGHSGIWADYLNGIRSTSKYTAQLWNFLQTDTNYKNKTAVFITNDHGRHLDGIEDGFVSHGDDCIGCRHISLVALGPDFKAGSIDSTTYSQIDITSTINTMFHLGMKHAKGSNIKSLVE